MPAQGQDHIGPHSDNHPLAQYKTFGYRPMPRLRAASLKGMTQITWLRYSIAFDVGLGALVLGASAILGITMPQM